CRRTAARRAETISALAGRGLVGAGDQDAGRRNRAAGSLHLDRIAGLLAFARCESLRVEAAPATARTAAEAAAARRADEVQTLREAHQGARALFGIGRQAGRRQQIEMRVGEEDRRHRAAAVPAVDA